MGRSTCDGLGTLTAARVYIECQPHGMHGIAVDSTQTALSEISAAAAAAAAILTSSGGCTGSTA
eukprot:m.79595 g.79595  ORF g.79595 m.79595 type:complete len:64 (+) comp19307_c0_seq1:217-408(+)